MQRKTEVTPNRGREENTKYPTNIPTESPSAREKIKHILWVQLWAMPPAPHNQVLFRSRKGSKQWETDLWDPSGVDGAVPGDTKVFLKQRMLGRGG